MAQHVVTAAGPPTAAPPSIGAHYIDSDTGQIYLGNGVASVDDWLLGGGGGASGGRLYRIEFSDDAGENMCLFSDDGGNSWKSTVSNPDDVGGAVGDAVQAVGDIIVFHGEP